MNMKNEQYLYKQIYLEAKSFYSYAETGFNNYLDGKIEAKSIIPFIVNLSFSCELYLKLILINNNLKIEELRKLSHNLLSLFNKLNVEQKNIIYEYFDKNTKYTIKELENELNKIQNSFPEWRYLPLNCFSNNNFNKLDFNPSIVEALIEILDIIAVTFIKID